MHISHILPFVAGLAAAIPESLTSAAADPDLQLAGIAYGGSGCSAGSVSVKPSADLSKLSLHYDFMAAQSGQNIPVSSTRRNCQVNVKFKYSSGWQFSVSKAEYSGYAQIPAGLTGLSKSTYYFSGESSQVSSNITINGPYDDIYRRTDELDVTRTVWSPCGLEGMLNINSEVRLSPVDTGQSAMLTLDALESLLVTWRRCGPAAPAPETPAGPSQ